MYRAVKAADRTFLAERVLVADTFWKRFRGLMMRPQLPPDEGLLIEPCSQIHMMFMRFPIDAAFLDEEDRVVFCYHSLAPWWGLSGWHRNAVKVLELPAGALSKANIQPGDRLLFEKRGC